ncbi:DUF1871 family protein [Bacillus mangrovi]|uniref:DUF1871 family protein n=1 Tax=Metabacillus mangrovi TaxID=1491830 RepID=A0A7X2S7X5_9BACI|nr:DUF1871 family protein [Metabacillus mangrovi]MTH55012.1 DUF1871 family protein [Metabacillus mangrovi]
MSNKHNQYKDTFTEIKKIVNEWDPMELLPSAPDDEYEYEIGRIVSLVSKVDSINSLADGISHIFTKAFSENFTKEKCLPVARKIWEQIK